MRNRKSKTLEIDDTIEAVVEVLKLKKEHTHAGKLFPAGTVLDELKASDDDINFMKVRDIV